MKKETMGKSKSNRVLIVGLDGATWDVLDPWTSGGSLLYLLRDHQSDRLEQSATDHAAVLGALWENRYEPSRIWQARGLPRYD